MKWLQILCWIAWAEIVGGVIATWRGRLKKRDSATLTETQIRELREYYDNHCSITGERL